MNRNLKYVKLKEICTVNQGLQIPIEKRFREDGKDRYFYITVQFLKEGFKDKYYIENPPISSICNEDDILVVRTGSTGQIITGVKGCFHNNFFKINYDKTKINGRYLYYCLTTKEKQEEMLKRAGITTIPDLNHFMFLDMKIPLLDIKYQDRIVKILDTISNKIEINNKISKELETMIQTIYDYWFLQFEFPNEEGMPYKSSGGKMVWNEELKKEIPADWIVDKIDNIIPVKDGTHDSPKAQNVGFPLITSKHLLEWGIDFGNANLISEEDYIAVNKRSKVETGDILFSMIGTVGTVYKVEEKDINFAIKNVALYKTSKKEEYKNYIYMHLRSWYMQVYMSNVLSGSIQKFIGLGDLRNMPLMIADTYIRKFEQTTKNLFEQINNLKIQNQELTKLRDWLLPMLMNGQVTFKTEDDEKEKYFDVERVAETSSEYGEG